MTLVHAAVGKSIKTVVGKMHKNKGTAWLYLYVVNISLLLYN
jgi:hypothetical protein